MPEAFPLYMHTCSLPAPALYQVSYLLRQLSSQWSATRLALGGAAAGGSSNGNGSTEPGAGAGPPLQSLAVAGGGGGAKITLVGESFGGCLALRIALAHEELLDSLVLVNPATCFGQAMGGLAALISATNLLALFPKDLYATAQVGGAGYRFSFFKPPYPKKSAIALFLKDRTARGGGPWAGYTCALVIRPYACGLLFRV